MQIASSRRHQQITAAPKKESTPAPNVQNEFPQDRFEPGWISAGLSVAGGVASLAGALSGRPLIAAGGLLVTAAATSATAIRVQSSDSYDTAAWVSFAGGGALMAASALVLASPQPVARPQGPLPQLLQKLGVPFN